MPQHKSPMKRMKTDAKRQARNNYVKRTLKTLDKQIRSEMPAEEKQELLDKIYSQLDKAAKKGVIHKRTASRRKARVAAYINSLK
ncbi:MAG: 30S ribosomal protein S20 [Candidatus Cloacimonadota bacterium]|jgi:small subunit ribosomal protein S20|nr:30S ribosomal protein S20 [Candidatus Cloacimonadota bacterium]NMD12865.1 30S ribosomal protein S20 [Candidatus Cloacimonadota bacterium]